MNARPLERTLSILKPDATFRNLTGAINQRFEEAGFEIIGQKRIWMTYQQAYEFYKVHQERPFFGELCRYISSGPVVAQVLEREDAVELHRKLMGATDPSKAERGTIRGDFGESIERNTVHGSDSQDTARQEIYFFFSDLEIFSSKQIQS